MTFDQVLVFHKIIQTGSFKAAAVEVHKTQPAISLSIKKLEEEMNVELFDRSAYRPILTEHGKAFFERSAKILQGMNDLEALSKSFRNQEEPEIKLAVDGVSPLPELLKLFKRFNDRHPNTKLNLGLDILFEAERRVQEREAEIGITHFISDPGSLEIIPIANVKMMPVMCAELYHERKVEGEAQLADIDQVVVGNKLERKDPGFGLLENGPKWRVTDHNFKREIIMAGLGWGHLPGHSIQRELSEGKLMILEFGQVNPKSLTINLIRLKKNQFGPVARSLWGELASLHGK